MKTFSFLLLAAISLMGRSSLARVVISSPGTGASIASPVAVSAYDTRAYSSSIALYLNGALVSRVSGSSLTTSLTLNGGTYTIQVVSQGGRSSSSATSTFTVPSSNASDPPSTPAVPDTPSTGTTTVADQIAADMQGQNEGFPHGVPRSYDWANGPVISMGNNSNGWQAITAWGALYEASEGNPAANTRVNIRNMQTYFLQKSTGKWLLLQNTSKPDGAAYVEDFAGDAYKAADVRTESDGTISVTAGGGFNFHFYPSERAAINPSDIGGIVTVFQGRLIVGDPSKADDRSSARYLLSSGADYYPALTGGWPGNTDFNPGVALGKMKYLRTEWRSFAMTTLTKAEIESNPPPIDLTGILP